VTDIIFQVSLLIKSHGKPETETISKATENAIRDVDSMLISDYLAVYCSSLWSPRTKMSDPSLVFSDAIYHYYASFTHNLKAKV